MATGYLGIHSTYLSPPQKKMIFSRVVIGRGLRSSPTSTMCAPVGLQRVCRPHGTTWCACVHRRRKLSRSSVAQSHRDSSVRPRCGSTPQSRRGHSDLGRSGDPSSRPFGHWHLSCLVAHVGAAHASFRTSPTHRTHAPYASLARCFPPGFLVPTPSPARILTTATRWQRCCDHRGGPGLDT